MRVFVALLAFICRTSLAVYADEANLVDYHLALLGRPSNSTFFHQPVPGSKASLIYTLSERNVLGAVNPKDGSVVWRRPLTSNTTLAVGGVSTAEGQDVLYGGVNDTAFSYSASDGRVVWESRQYDAIVKDVATLKSLDEKQSPTQNKDVVVLREGNKHTVQKLNATTGAVEWTFDDSSGNTPYRVVASNHGIHYIALSKAMLKGYKVHVTTLDPRSGKSQDHVTLNSDNEIASKSEIVYTGDCGSLGLLVWTDSTKSTFKANVLGSKNIASFDAQTIPGGVTRMAIHASPGHTSKSDFLVEFSSSVSHSAQVFNIAAKKDPKKATISKSYDLPKLGEPGSFASSSVGDDVYFVRISGEIQIFSSASHGILARWPLKTGQSSPVSVKDWHPVHAAVEVVARSDSTYALRSVVLQNTGDWVLARNGDVVWNRPEQLSGIVAAGWLTANKSSTVVNDIASEEQASPVPAFVHRLQRHVAALSSLPDVLRIAPSYIYRWLDTLLTGSDSARSKDHAFGFDKHIFALLDTGDCVSIDPMRPTVIRKATDVEADELRTITRSKYSILEKVPDREFTYQVEDSGLSGKALKGNLWYFPLPTGQNIISISSANPSETIASIGKPLGDRTVLYKYLNPNAILVLASEVTTINLSVYLLDAISGALLYSTHHSSVDFSRPISSLVSENWFTYSFSTFPNSTFFSRGHHLVMAECYESELPNDRGPLGASQNYSAVVPPLATPGSLKPNIISQTYQIPEEITRMTSTQTTQGISSRELVATLSHSKGIVSIPHYVLDPRRPVDKPTSQQAEEGLIQYNAVIEFDPKWYLTHFNEVLGIEHMISSPSDMESTSLVFAYGLDVFGTRVAPSFAFDILGPSFNKVQLVLTVVALTAGVFVVAPLIARKQTNQLWQVN